MQTDRGELNSPTEWFLITLDGDLVVKLAHGLRIGEDANGDLVLDPEDRPALLRISKEEAVPILQVLSLDRTLRLPDGRSVQYLSLDTKLAVRVRLPSNTLSLSTNFVAAGKDPEYLDVTLVQAVQPAIVSERVAIAPEPATGPEATDDLIGPVPEAAEQGNAAEDPHVEVTEEISDADYRTVAEPVTPIPEIPAPVQTNEAGPSRFRRAVKILVMVLIAAVAALLTIRTGD
jgi:hypothetical protein